MATANVTKKRMVEGAERRRGVRGWRTRGRLRGRQGLAGAAGADVDDLPGARKVDTMSSTFGSLRPLP